MDATLERMMREHLDGAMEREKELAVMRNRLQRGDDNFAEITETLSDISSKVTRLVLLMDGCEVRLVFYVKLMTTKNYCNVSLVL